MTKHRKCGSSFICGTLNMGVAKGRPNYGFWRQDFEKQTYRTALKAPMDEVSGTSPSSSRMSIGCMGLPLARFLPLAGPRHRKARLRTLCLDAHACRRYPFRLEGAWIHLSFHGSLTPLKVQGFLLLIRHT